MSVASEIAAYKITVIDNITSKTLINSISPENVGDASTDLADLIEPWLELVEFGQEVFGEIYAPTVEGSNGDWWFQISGGTFYVYRKISGSWVAKVSLTIGIVFPDGPLINLRVSVSGFDATVTPGGWVINNVIYQKLTQTAFVIPAADLNFDRYDLIYADTAGQVLYTAGVASSTPAFPVTPANTIVVDYIIVPSSASGASPYSYYGAAGGNPNMTALFPGVSDINGEYDLSSSGIQEFPIATIYDENELQATYAYDNSDKTIKFMPPSTAFTIRFSI